MHTDSSCDVIILYLIDIGNCYSEYLKGLINIVPQSHKIELSKLYLSENEYKNYYLYMLNSIKGSINYTCNQKFRLNLIRSKIFNHCTYIYFNNISDISEVLIIIENRIIQFLKENFGYFPYSNTKSKEILDMEMLRRGQNIEKLRLYRSA